MDKIYFTVNGEHYSLSGSDVSPRTSLNDYLRNYLNLYGTKVMCREGGCGACIVAVSQTHPDTKETHVFSVNSCLVHILSCHNWDITTIEGIGNKKNGYHAIQTRLAAFNGTQCGYCTPGWIMNMYSIDKRSNEKLSMRQIEDSFGSNMCRCTGYRSILDAFKSFASDLEPELKNKVQDLEDLHKLGCRNTCERRCSALDEEWCIINKKSDTLLAVGGDGSRWYKAFTIKDVFKILSKEGVDSYRFVAGNTGQGVYPITTEPRVLIDISSIAAIKGTWTDGNLVIGAGMTLTEVMNEFQKWANENEDFAYLNEFYKHLSLVAHIPVRNIGTIAGNLSLKNKHNNFPSDLFLIFATVEAAITIVNDKLDKQCIDFQEFLKTDLTNKLITEVKLPPLPTTCLIKTYKIMARAQNVHAIVNAGFLFKLDTSNKIVSTNIVYGSMSPTFVNAVQTERALKDSQLYNEETLQKALSVLNTELSPDVDPPEASPQCRKTIALALFYKALLSLCPNVNPRYKSGGTELERELSKGTQTFDTDKSIWPLNKPVPKLEALSQCSGEARYSCDVNPGPRTVHVAFVLSDVSVAEIDRFDPSEALKVSGVIAFLTAKDIPGKNTFTPTNVPWQEVDEEILASNKVLYYGQPVGLIVAISHNLAVSAAKLVKVYYKNNKAKPVLTIQDALTAPDKDKRIRKEVTTKATDRGQDIKQVIKGALSIPSQYHYTMETQSCTVIPTENGVEVRSATQWMDLIHVAVANMLSVQQNKVEVIVNRVGGAYGGKASRSSLIACAAALAATACGRAASLVLPIDTNMAAIGKRQECLVEYELGVNNSGVIQYLNVSYYSDCGWSYNDTAGSAIASVLANLYDSSRWTITGYSVLTDKASNTWCRAPGTTEAIAIHEHLMERIAYATKLDPVDVRIANIAEKHSGIKDMIATLKYSSNYDTRKTEIATYNSENAWKKKGLKLSIMSFPIEYSWNFPVTVSVYHGDGTVAISQGGIEMGQGINTKIAQVCAYTLKIPLEKVSVIGSNSFVSPNAMCSNGSITSDCVAYATLRACKELLNRFEDIKENTNEPWEETVKKAFEKGINLQASYMTSPLDSLQCYDVYGVCAIEVELDVLTGTHVVKRVDLLEDAGISLSPDIDVGQIEGAFIMGLGLWTTEQLVYDQKTGRLLTDRTWTYHPPGAKDIPVDFRITLQPNAPNPAGVLRSKATGEPALTLAVGVTFALHDAILDARKEFGYKDTEWLSVDVPYSVENILKAISPNYEYYKLY
ncbi:uncharacterized protein LOC113513041 [Galleria mellonella]|uniref:Uncharacterized protein LOC113513041 n=1 Tax=Galleria mellonella TaxID=7137 RepID=A0ABM3MBL0_GALME|nr:uncharacterized protein LOC113513041 [Galleria mellonella]